MNNKRLNATCPAYTSQAGILTKEQLLDICEREKQIHLIERGSNKKAVEFIKAKLGKQSYTWQVEFRFWTWDFPDKKWLVHVSNLKGICFEVNYGCSYEEIKNAQEEFLNMLRK